MLFLAMFFHRLRIGEKHGRCPDHRGIDETEIIDGVMRRPGQLRVGADGFGVRSLSLMVSCIS